MPPVEVANATRFLPKNFTSVGTPVVPFLYQTGVPLVSRIIAYDAATAFGKFAVRYQPGVGAPAAGCRVALIVGKSCGKQRIQYCADCPCAFVASTIAPLFSVRFTGFDCDGLGAVEIGQMSRTDPPATAVVLIVTALVPAAHRSA